MRQQSSLLTWPELPEDARAKLAALSSLYSNDSLALWMTIGGELRYLCSGNAPEALPVFVKRVWAFSHAQLFVQGLPILLPQIADEQILLFQTLRQAYSRVTLVDFQNRIESTPPHWSRQQTATELLSISPDFEPPDPDLRSELRKSVREGLVVDFVTSDDDRRDAFALFDQHGKQDARRFPPLLLDELARLAQSHPDICWLLARQNGIAVGSQIFIRMGEILLYWLSVLDRNAVAAKPAVALLNEGIRRGALLGASTCNLGWSPPSETGLTAFKRRWGSNAHDYSIYTTRPWWWPK